MRIRLLIVGALLGAAVALLGATALSQDRPQDMTPEAMAEMMAEWVKLGQPGEPHQHFVDRAGTYDIEWKIWMGGPDAPPTISTGTSRIEAILGGRYMLDHMQATMMMPGPTGMVETPFEGFGVTGYNNIRNVYESSWIDNQSTYMGFMKGTQHPATGVITMYGEMDEPGMKMYGRYIKTVLTQISPDKTTFEMFDLAVSDDYKVMEITYTRQ